MGPLSADELGATRTCYRCGALIDRRRARICQDCRKPPGPKQERPWDAPLSFRDRQVVDCVAEGLRNKEIAYLLGLSEGTIKEYMYRIFRKVGVTSRSQLAVMRVCGRL